MSVPPSHSRAQALAQLRNAIGAIESTSADLARKTPSPRTANQPSSGSADTGTPRISYPGMPEGKDWMDNLPAWCHDGENGFVRRLMEDLAAVGVPCYTVNDLTKVRSIPQGIPIFLDWLTHLEERIPGPETPHREAIRGNLIRNLNDAAARGNPQVVNALIDQLKRQPRPKIGVPDYAAHALAKVATKREFPQIAAVLAALPADGPKGPLIEYMGKVKTPEARDIALAYLDTEWAYYAIKALIAMKAEGARARIEAHLNSPNSAVRRYARQAMEKLPE
ncbi:HEAT repeat domain-containing protein [Mycolicibacterium sp. Y3]